MAEQSFGFAAVMLRQPGHLLMAAGVHAVEDGVAQRGAAFVHGHAVAAERREPHAPDLPCVYAALGEDLARKPAKAAPPILLCVMLKPPGLGIHQGMALAGEGHNIACFVDQRRFALVGAHVDSKKITRQTNQSFRF